MTESYLDIIDKNRLAEVLRDLVRIPSVNPGFPNGHGEQDVAEYVKRFFDAAGLSYEVQPVEAGRENVIGTLNGLTDRHLLLEAHMDTVQTEGMTVDPFGGHIENGRLYGRGACDTKASLAAMLVAIETMAAGGMKPPVHVHLAAVVDEEITYKGVSVLATEVQAGRLRYDAAIVGEPTGLDLIIAHKGVLRFHVDVKGVAAHSSMPSLGVNAIEHMAEVILYLKQLARTEWSGKAHPLTGPPTLCISMIQGGVAPNTVAEHCRITIDRRTVPGEEWENVWEELRHKLKQLETQVPGLQVEVHRPFLTDFSMETASDDPLVLTLSGAAGLYAPGRRIIGAPYGSDASKLTRIGIPAVVFGPGDLAQAHTKDEWVNLEEVAAAAAVLVHTAMGFGRF